MWHLVLNLLALIVLGAYAERVLGSIAFLIVFAASGIFGNILGGNFASTTTPSVGASGAIRKFYFVMIKLVIEERKKLTN